MTPQTRKAALGLYLSGVGLESLLDDLTRVGFRNEDVCAVLPQTHSAARSLLSSKLSSKSPGHQPDAGADVEDVAEWFAQFGAVIIPGIGAFVAGPEFAGLLPGSAHGGITGDSGLYELGLSGAQVERYQEWVRGGGVMVYVCCNNRSPCLLRNRSPGGGRSGRSLSIGCSRSTP